MKKTISVNIKGMNFLIEEDAYELLQNYLDRLTHALQNDKGGKEIFEDIELRIAELCSEQLNDRKQVIEVSDIEKILTTLGDPAQYVEEEIEADSDQNQSRSQDQSAEKRIYRDTDHAVIAGVCSGIANYTNIDVVIVRAIFAAILIFGGFGFPLYVVLWIIIPKATNTIDKLRMQGKPITVENVRDEVEQAAHRISKGSEKFAQRIRKDDSYQRRISSVGRIFSVLFGTGILSLGLLFLVLFVVFIVGGFQVIPVQSDFGFLSFPEFGELIAETSSDQSWGWAGILLLGFSSILFLLLLGSKIVFRIRNTWSRMSLGLLFFSGLAGLIICFFIGMKTAREMSIEGEIEKKLGSVNGTELQIKTVSPKVKSNFSYEIKSKGRFGMMSIEGNRIFESGVQVDYKLSKDSLFHVYQNFTAHSHSHQKAIKKAKNIKHKTELKDSQLMINSHYSFPKSDKLRDQDVHIIIEVPANGKIYWNGVLVIPGEHNTSLFEEELEDHRGYIGSDGKYETWEW